MEGDSRVLLIYRFARAKGEPLVNIIMIYSNKKIKSCNAKRQRERERQKINRSNEKKNFARAAHFFVHFSVVVLHTT